MTLEEFKNYLDRFEQQVVVEGVKQGRLGKNQLVPLRDGRLSRRRYGRVMGVRFDCSMPIAVNYYGLVKKSIAFDELLKEVQREQKVQIKMIEVTVVHFASIKIEVIALLAPHLVADFPAFKKRLLQLRGFS